MTTNFIFPLLFLVMAGALVYVVNKKLDRLVASDRVGPLITELETVNKTMKEILVLFARATSAAPKHQGIIEVVKKQEDRWAHFGWVRKNSPAAQAALDKPGFALRDDGKVEEGVQ